MVQFTFGVLCIIPGEQNTVLLVRTTYGDRKWQLPGGYVEADESPVEALSRELWEECSLRIETPELFGFYFKIYQQNFNIIFVCPPPKDKPKPGDKEIAEVGFFPISDLPAAVSIRQRKILSDWVAGAKGPLVWVYRDPLTTVG